MTAAGRAVGVPTPGVLVVAGLFFGFLPFVPDVTLGPEVLLIGVLPLLVYQTAFVSSPGALYQNAGPIGLLAVGLVLVTAGVTAVVGRGSPISDVRWHSFSEPLSEHRYRCCDEHRPSPRRLITAPHDH